MTERRSSRDDRLRDLLRRTATHGEPQVGGLVESVPAMLAEAARRRARGSTPAARLSVAGRTWLPRLAAATALLAVAAFVRPTGSSGSSTTGSSTAADEGVALDSWIVTGSSSETVSDPVLDALVR